MVDPKNIFYADVAEPLASKAAHQVRPQSLLSFDSASGQTYYGDPAYENRRTYLHTSKDQTMPPVYQDAFVTASGTEWKVQKLDAGHSPFLSQPKQLAAIIVAQVKAFIATY